MEFIVHDTLTAMADLLSRPLEERPGALRELLDPIRPSIPMPGDVIDIHHSGGGFRVDAEDPRYLPAVRAMIEADVLGQVERELRRASQALKGAEQAESLQVMFMLGNPDNEHLMKIAGGYYGMGGSPGWLYLLAWPSEEVIGRIAHCAVHEFHHNVRYTNVEWNPQTVTVAEHVMAEGLAEAFVRELSGPEAMGPWSAMVQGEELERADEVIMAAFGLQGMWNTPAYVLGDGAMEQFGQEPRGVPDMAGYAVGLRLVDEVLARTGLTAAEATVLPAAELLRRAGLPQPGESHPGTPQPGSPQPGETNPDS
ncbi:MAG: peptidase [Nonomuraea sp.]|nr:peptidase [Nonomuraea sp.]